MIVLPGRIKMKFSNSIYYSLGLSVILAASIVWLNFKSTKKPNVFLEGKALGVFYAIHYEGDPRWEKSLDSLIHEIDLAVNLQLPNSEISRFNRFGFLENYSPHFIQILETSTFYHYLSGGVVSHTMLPLISAWGRGFSNKTQMTKAKVDGLISLCDLRNVEIGTQLIKANQEGIMLDMNYLDKGYLIDLLAKFLLKKGIQNFQIEFGLDGFTNGHTHRKNSLNFLNNLPEEFKNASFFKIKDLLKNTAYSSSGNLDKFYVDEYGNKHSHLIDPRTGYPISNGILTTHIIASRCIKADAVATMCMILDLEDSISMISNDPELEGIIIYNKNGKLQTWLSPGIRKI